MTFNLFSIPQSDVESKKASLSEQVQTFLAEEKSATTTSFIIIERLARQKKSIYKLHKMLLKLSLTKSGNYSSNLSGSKKLRVRESSGR